SGVVLFDPACPRPYSRRSLEEGGLGGTEATVIRLAEALDARVMQHNRREAEDRYLPPGRVEDAQSLIVVRDPRPLADIARGFPRARVYLWLHDLMRPGSTRGRRLSAVSHELSRLGVTLVCVSDFLRGQVQAVLRAARASSGTQVVTIYNPVDDAL